MDIRLEPEELLLAALLRRAIKDAQGKQERTRDEAVRWLWEHRRRWRNGLGCRRLARCT